MLFKEFVMLTGYQPTYEEYEQIERNYYKFDGDKHEFCKAWLLVNQATVTQYKTRQSKLHKMETKLCEISVDIRDTHRVVEYLSERIDKWQKREARLNKSFHQLCQLIDSCRNGEDSCGRD